MKRMLMLLAGRVRVAGVAGRVGLVLLTSLTASGALAQTWPARPVRLIVPYAPGGATDILARLVAQKLTGDLGQSVFVDNKPGGGSVIGTQAVSQAEPDGHTLGFLDIAFATNPGLLKDKLPYDSLRDFAPLSQVAIAPLVMVVHPSVPAKSVAGFLDFARRNAGKVNYSSGGIGSGTHLAGEQFKVVTGTDILHVAYKGAGPGIQAIVAGEVQLTYATPASIVGHVNSGRVVALAILANARLSLLPNVPTVADVGMANLSASPFFGAFAPPRTAPALQASIERAFVRYATDPEVQKQLRQQGFEPVGSGREAFADFLRAEIQRWNNVIARANIKPE